VSSEYAVVFCLALLARLVLTVLPVSFITPGQQRLWSWEFFTVFALCFVVAVWLAARAGVPPPSRFARGPAVWVPIGMGVVVGAATIVTDLISPAAAARGVAALHIRGMAAIPFYLYGAVLLTVVFHFLPVAAGAWLARRLHGGARRAVLALTLVLVALSEDLTFFLTFDGKGAVETVRHVLSVLANGSEAILIYRFGLLSGLVQRASTYLVWHLAWPAIAEWAG
jgi:hypothetical protein